MRFRRFSAWILVLMLLISCFAGCKKKEQGKSAAAGDYVAGTSGTVEEDSDAKSDEETDSQQKESTQDSRTTEQSNAAEDADSGKTDEKEKSSSTDETNDSDADIGDVNEDPYDVPISKTLAKTEDGVSYYQENKLKVVSYNIRCADDPNGNSIEERAPRLMEVLEKYDPDLIGFQEFVVEWEEPAYFGLSDDYDYVLKYRAATSSEGTPIYYKKSKFKLLDEGYFWLSETPEKESKGWGADYYRICSWVKLEIRQTGKVIYFFNTHFDFKDDPQVNSAKLLIKQATAICKGAPMIVSADYNMTWDSKGYAEMTSYFTDVNVKRDTTKTYSGYKDPASSLIDFIFVTGKSIKPAAYDVMDEKPNGKYVSDHYGVYSEIIIL